MRWAATLRAAVKQSLKWMRVRAASGLAKMRLMHLMKKRFPSINLLYRHTVAQAVTEAAGAASQSGRKW
eukprot:scaffold84969_cov19-Tisochrysis_lutea.AAC.2